MSDITMSVTVTKSCIGAGLCIAVAPEHFEFHRGRARRTRHPIDSEEVTGLVLAAIDVCPAAAIVTGNS
ncbi:ferredoxin [Rhodococcoides fascians A21d2]|nr:ferredoxin [Rhodococcus fascians A21d2]